MFDLNNATEKSTGPIYQRPGISDNVKVSKVSTDKTLTNKVPYLQLDTIGENGEVGKSTRMFLSTEKKEGKKTSAWAVTARNLVDLISVTHNVSEDEAKAMIKVESIEALVLKLSAILVGRPFRAKFKGTQTAKGAIIAELAGVESMNVSREETRLRFDEVRDIEKYQGPAPTSAPVAGVESDLPF